MTPKEIIEDVMYMCPECGEKHKAGFILRFLMRWMARKMLKQGFSPALIKDELQARMGGLHAWK